MYYETANEIIKWHMSYLAEKKYKNTTKWLQRVIDLALYVDILHIYIVCSIVWIH